MKKAILVFLALFLIFTLSNPSFAYLIPRMDRINITVGVEVSLYAAQGKYVYNYTITSLPDSEQDLEGIQIEYEGANPEVSLPDNWWYVGPSRTGGVYEGEPYVTENRTPNNKLYMFLSPEPEERLKPGNTQGDLIIESAELPAIVTYYAQGYAPLPKRPDHEERLALLRKYVAEGNLKAADALEKEDMQYEEGPDNPELESMFVNCVKGKTLGPVDMPDPFDPPAFLDLIIGQKEEAVTLGWIKDPGISTSLDQKLANAKKQIEKGNPSAKNILEAVLNELEAQKGKQVTDEAYYLLKFNILYLVERL